MKRTQLLIAQKEGVPRYARTIPNPKLLREFRKEKKSSFANSYHPRIKKTPVCVVLCGTVGGEEQ